MEKTPKEINLDLLNVQYDNDFVNFTKSVYQFYKEIENNNIILLLYKGILNPITKENEKTITHEFSKSDTFLFWVHNQYPESKPENIIFLRGEIEKKQIENGGFVNCIKDLKNDRDNKQLFNKYEPSIKIEQYEKMIIDNEDEIRDLEEQIEILRVNNI